jgi:CDP-diacylglycerol---serine O-phosphatidyltransferase
MRNLRYLVPNAFTITSMLLGLASASRSAAGDYHIGAWMILWGVLLDKLDGSSARLLKASSPIGGELDSFADFAVFGIAPAALVYFRVRALGLTGTTALALLIGACAVYVAAAAVRLARFNITTPPLGDRLFYGVPTTLCGAMIAAGFLTWEKHPIDERLLLYSPAVLVVLGALMVSRLLLPKLKRRRSLPLNLFQYGNVAVAYVCGPLMLVPEYLFGLASTYALGGVLWCLAFPPDTTMAASAERELAA